MSEHNRQKSCRVLRAAVTNSHKGSGVNITTDCVGRTSHTGPLGQTQGADRTASLREAPEEDLSPVFSGFQKSPGVWGSLSPSSKPHQVGSFRPHLTLASVSLRPLPASSTPQDAGAHMGPAGIIRDSRVTFRSGIRHRRFFDNLNSPLPRHLTDSELPGIRTPISSGSSTAAATDGEAEKAGQAQGPGRDRGPAERRDPREGRGGTSRCPAGAPAWDPLQGTRLRKAQGSGPGPVTCWGGKTGGAACGKPTLGQCFPPGGWRKSRPSWQECAPTSPEGSEEGSSDSQRGVGPIDELSKPQATGEVTSLYSIPRFTPRRTENVSPRKNSHANVPSSIITSSQTVEPAGDHPPPAPGPRGWTSRLAWPVLGRTRPEKGIQHWCAVLRARTLKTPS